MLIVITSILCKQKKISMVCTEKYLTAVHSPNNSQKFTADIIVSKCGKKKNVNSKQCVFVL